MSNIKEALAKIVKLDGALASNDALSTYVVLDEQRGNLATARHQIAAVEKGLVP